MDTLTSTDKYAQLEETLGVLPKEVKNFLYKGAVGAALETIATESGLTVEQKSALYGKLLFVVAQLESRDTLLELAKKWGFTQEQINSFVVSVEKNIFIPLYEATNYTIIDEEPEQTLSPDAFASIQERLAKPASIAPASRDYTVYNTPSTPSAAPKTETKLDPYREMPE